MRGTLRLSLHLLTYLSKGVGHLHAAIALTTGGDHCAVPLTIRLGMLSCAHQSIHTHGRVLQMNNVKNQSPCLIASWSVVPCQENCELPMLFMFTRKLRRFTAWIIAAISSAPYLGPLPGSALFQCQCNTVHYSLIAACGACQGFHGAEGIEKYVSRSWAV